MSFTKASKLLDNFKNAEQRVHIVGDLSAGAIIALDMEGRVFTVLKGKVLNRVNLEAIAKKAESNQYFSPGGDVLWPAPEGTSLGYFYSTGQWRVPPSLSNAKYFVRNHTKDSAQIHSEIDLINNQSLGIPTVFNREINLVVEDKSLSIVIDDSIKYIGERTLSNQNCLLAPWTLCQLNCNINTNVQFPFTQEESYWNLYNSSFDGFAKREKDYIKVKTNGESKFQIGLAELVPWIKYKNNTDNLSVDRSAELISPDENYIDIRDASPDVKPSSKGVRYSIYNDSGGFMEIEAVGGTTSNITSNRQLSLSVVTKYTIADRQDK